MQPKFRISVVNFGNRNEPRRNARSSEILFRLSCTSSRSCSCVRLASRGYSIYYSTYFPRVNKFSIFYFAISEKSERIRKKREKSWSNVFFRTIHSSKKIRNIRQAWKAFRSLTSMLSGANHFIRSPTQNGRRALA